MEPKEKSEQLLEEQSQKLKKELNKYKTMIDSANILIMPINDKKRYIKNLLEHQKTFLLLFPQLTSNFQILKFFYDNNALEIEQVQIAINNILTDEIVKDCLSNIEKYQLQVKSLESQIKELDEKSLTAKASFILKANITDEEKISILKEIAYESCKSVTKKEEKLKSHKIPTPQEEIESLFTEEETPNINQEELNNIKGEYYKIKNNIESIMSKYYYLINGKDEKYINYNKEMSRAIKEQESKDNLDLSTLGIDEFQYKDISMTVLILDMFEVKAELESQLNNPTATLEDIRDYFNMLKEDYNKAISLDKILTEEKKEEEKTTNEIYFLLDENNNSFFQINKFNKEEKKHCLSLIEKFKKGLHDYEKGKKHTKLLSNNKRYNIYINKSSNMCVSYVRTKDNKVLVLTFAPHSDIYDNSNTIAQTYSYVIDENLTKINNQNPNYLKQQKEFTEQFKSMIAVKGDDHK